MRLLIALLLLLANSVLAANHYVREGQSGDGSAWNNALGNLPATLTRGDTYYLADGWYGGYNFTTVASGTTFIYVKKATAADHGTETGWSSAYGDARAWFGPSTHDVGGYAGGYIDINGYSAAVTNLCGIIVTNDRFERGFDFPSGSGSAPHFKFRYMEFQGPGVGPYNYNDLGDPWTSGIIVLPWDYDSYSDTSYMVISHCYFHGNETHVYDHQGQIRPTIEYSKFYDQIQTGSGHANIYFCSNPGGVFRYNEIWMYNTEGLIFGQSNSDWEIYGNVFHSSGNLGTSRGLEFYYDRVHSNVKVYNNTFVDMALVGIRVGAPITITAEFYNNLFLNSGMLLENGGTGIDQQNNVDDNLVPDVGYSGGGSYSLSVTPGTKYIWFKRSNDTSAQNGVSTYTDEGGVSFTASGSTVTLNGTPSAAITARVYVDPFVDFAGDDYRLSGPTTAGTEVASPFDVDPDGTIRGGDSVWDVGAYEYDGSSPNPVVITSTTDVLGTNGWPFSYSITVSNGATSYGATNLPAGLTLSGSAITGTPSETVTNSVGLFATNAAGWDVEVNTFTILPPEPLIWLSKSTNWFLAVVTNGISDTTITVSNAVGGTVTGAASTAAPFSIVGNANYAISGTDTTNITVRFSPTAATNYVGTVTFTGGGGATAGVRGIGYIVQPTTAMTVTNGTLVSPLVADSGNFVSQPADTELADAGYLVLGFTAPSNGNYFLESVVNAASAMNNSFWLEMNDNVADTADIWDINPITSGFQTRVVSARGNGTFDNPEFPTNVWTLSSGVNYVMVRGREPDAQLRTLTLRAAGEEAPAGEGSAWYVDNTAAGLNSGTSITDAWQSMADVVWGVSGVAAGDTLFISGGATTKTYAESWTVGASGSQGSPITIRTATNASHTGVVIFDLGSYGNFSPSNVVNCYQQYVTFDGGASSNMAIVNCANQTNSYGACGIYGEDTEAIKVLHVNFTNVNNPVRLVAPGPGEIEGCEVAWCWMERVRGEAAVGMFASEGASFDVHKIHNNVFRLAYNAESPPGYELYLGPDGLQTANSMAIFSNRFEILVVADIFTSDQHPDYIQSVGNKVRIFDNEFINVGDSHINLGTTQNPTMSEVWCYNNVHRITTEIDPYPEYFRMYSSSTPTEAISSIKIFNNTFLDNTGGYRVFRFGPWFGNPTATGIEIKNNLFINCGNGSAVDTMVHIDTSTAYTASAFSFGGNVFYSTNDNYISFLGTNYTFAQWATNETTASTNLPTFVGYVYQDAASDVHLDSTDTVAKDTGQNLSAYFERDAEYVYRPQGSAWDRGAFEATSAPPPAGPTNLSVLQGTGLSGGARTQ